MREPELINLKKKKKNYRAIVYGKYWIYIHFYSRELPSEVNTLSLLMKMEDC